MDKEKFVTRDDCEQMRKFTKNETESIFEGMGRMERRLQGLNSLINKFNDAIFGITKHGKQIGGLVSLVDEISRDVKDIKNNPHKESSEKKRFSMPSSEKLIGILVVVVLTLLGIIIGQRIPIPI